MRPRSLLVQWRVYRPQLTNVGYGGGQCRADRQDGQRGLDMAGRNRAATLAGGAALPGWPGLGDCRSERSARRWLRLSRCRQWVDPMVRWRSIRPGEHAMRLSSRLVLSFALSVCVLGCGSPAFSIEQSTAGSAQGVDTPAAPPPPVTTQP